MRPRVEDLRVFSCFGSDNPQHPSGGTAGQVRFPENRYLKPPRGALRGGGTYHNGGMGASAPITYLPA